MITALPTRKLLTLMLGFFFYINTISAGIEPVPIGSFIVNMGVVPQTYANGLKPWGMVWNLIHNYKVPVKWVINQGKTKDGIDFTYNGTDFKGGPFIILKKYRTAAVDSVINYWQTQGIVGVTTTSAFNVDVTYTIKYNPLWTFDFQNGKIAINYLTIAGIPTSGYPMKDPSALNDCDDIFVMPHADPTWDTHKNLFFWNTKNRGWIWYGCHAGSVIESTVNPIDSSQQMNFLTTTGLVNFANHGNPTTPYSYRFDSDPEMQFMGTVDDAVTNGSEQVYLPKLGGSWRPGTHVGVWDPSDPDIPLLSKGEGAIIAYGRGFGDSTRGEVMFQAGHRFDKNNSAAVSAIRAFFNFSYLSVLDKIVTPIISGVTSCNAGSAYTYSATLPAGYSASNYTFHWTSNGDGIFSNEFGASTTYTPSAVLTPTKYTLTVTITDGCGREYYQTMDITVSGVPPVLGTLPLQLMSFNALKSGTDDLLQWTTSQEINSHHFDVEHSMTGNNFIQIGTVTAKGNSAIKSDYSFTDKNVTNGVHYYRLKLISADGNYKFSNIVVIKRDGQSIIISKFMPNPFKDKIEIYITSENTENTRFDIYDVNGRIMKSINEKIVKGSNNIIINGLDNLTGGIYFLKIKNNQIEVEAKLFKSLK